MMTTFDEALDHYRDAVLRLARIEPWASAKDIATADAERNDARAAVVCARYEATAVDMLLNVTRKLIEEAHRSMPGGHGQLLDEAREACANVASTNYGRKQKR